MNKQAFTLIELLVVIAIIGILGTVILTSLLSSNQNAREAAYLSDVRQLQVRANLYYSNLQGFGPAGEYTACDTGVFADTEFTRIKNIIIQKISGTVTCAIGQQGESFAATFTSAEYGQICVDQSRVTPDVSHVWVSTSTPIACL